MAFFRAARFRWRLGLSDNFFPIRPPIKVNVVYFLYIGYKIIKGVLSSISKKGTLGVMEESYETLHDPKFDIANLLCNNSERSIRGLEI
jgi:hypothetical protein